MLLSKLLADLFASVNYYITDSWALQLPTVTADNV